MTNCYGRRAPKLAPALKLASVLRTTDLAAIPPHPTSEDYASVIRDWAVLGNDRYGDCVAVTWANERYVVTSLLADRPTYPGMDEVVALYKTQNPGFPTQDDGMDIQTALEYLHGQGGPDGVKAVAFAKVDHTSLDEVKAALAIFGVVWVGVSVRAANQTEFAAGQPWGYDPESPVDGGHSVMASGYLGQAANDVRFVTWGVETAFTDDFWSHQVEEAWVVVWPEHLGTQQFAAGIDTAALAGAYYAVTGRTLPAPAGAADPDAQLAVAARGWVRERHVGDNERMKVALEAWLAAKRLA
jgi:hypothetical protein